MDLVRALRADVVTIQEAEPRHFEALSEVLPHGAFHPGRRATGMGMSLRYPVEVRHIPLAWRPAPWMRLEPANWPGLTRSLDVIGVHIAAPHMYLPPGQGIWLRRQQVRALEAHFEELFGSLEGGDGPPDGDGRGTLLLGDFNATPLWPVYRRLSAHFTDAAIAVGQRLGRGALPSWGTRPGGPRLLRIDHAFTRGVYARDFHVVSLAGSDHSAVVVDLSV